MARKAKDAKSLEQAPELDALEEDLIPEYKPSEADGDMFGGTPAK